MARDRIRRSSRRGLAVAVIGWLGVAAFSVLMAPGASAAPTAIIEIKNFTPPLASVDKGGLVTFVNRIPAQNRGGISLPLAGSLSATVFTDVAVGFFGETRPLQTDQWTTWAFNDPATQGVITYTYRIVPQAGLTADVASQVVNTVASQLPPLPAPIPYVVQTIAPNLPNLPGVNIPQLPQIDVKVPLPLPLPTGGLPLPTGPGAPAPAAGGPTVQGIAGSPYVYNVGATGSQLAPSRTVAAAAFDPSRFSGPGGNPGGGSSGSSGGSGGGAGGYDGVSVPVFGQLAGLNGAGPADARVDEAASNAPAPQTLPAAALVAVIALAAATAALVRTHQASRASR